MQDHFGLFDTPPARRHVQFAVVVAGLMVAAFAVVFSFSAVRLRPIETFVPVIDLMMVVGELIIAALLYGQASVFRSRALTALATGYVLSALLLVAHALSFPGGFAPAGLLGGGIDSAPWLYAFRRTAIPIGVFSYVLYKRADLKALPRTERRAPKVWMATLIALAVAGGLTALVSLAGQSLPDHHFHHLQEPLDVSGVYQAVVLVFVLATTVMLYRQRTSVLDVWMLVALLGSLLQAVAILNLQARFTVGWYGLFGITLLSHLVVLLVLMVESNRLYAQLAVSTASWRRERETRLLSIDAVAAAVSHEIGQPLTGVSTHARAGLNWLTREPPNVEMAAESMRATVDAARRTTEAVKSVRGIFARRQGAPSEFSLNDLVRSTALALDAELASRKVTLQCTLDRELPPIEADRVQIQRVLVNLLTNAIESVGATRGRHRRISIRTATAEDDHVLLEITDNGLGIEPEALPTIFEAFVSTKTHSAGLGLWLSRTIVESNGGHLWATPAEPHGATFHLRLPRAGT